MKSTLAALLSLLVLTTACPKPSPPPPTSLLRGLISLTTVALSAALPR